MNRTLDTNLIQSLFILKMRPDKVEALENANTLTDMLELYQVAKKISKGKREFYITPQIMEEVEKCETKLPGIVKFARENFLMSATTSPRMIQTIIDLASEYLKEDIWLNDTTRAPQSAVQIEYKDGLPSRADAQIVSENNVLYGQPLHTLNEKHLICMVNSRNPNSPKRSAAILNKNKAFVNGYPLQKVAKRNLKKLTATTFKVRHINRCKEDLINAFIQEM